MAIGSFCSLFYLILFLCNNYTTGINLLINIEVGKVIYKIKAVAVAYAVYSIQSSAVKILTENFFISALHHR